MWVIWISWLILWNKYGLHLHWILIKNTNVLSTSPLPISISLNSHCIPLSSFLFPPQQIHNFIYTFSHQFSSIPSFYLIKTMILPWVMKWYHWLANEENGQNKFLIRKLQVFIKTSLVGYWPLIFKFSLILAIQTLFRIINCFFQFIEFAAPKSTITPFVHFCYKFNLRILCCIFSSLPMSNLTKYKDTAPYWWKKPNNKLWALLTILYDHQDIWKF